MKNHHSNFGHERNQKSDRQEPVINQYRKNEQTFHLITVRDVRVRVFYIITKTYLSIMIFKCAKNGFVNNSSINSNHHDYQSRYSVGLNCINN